MIKSAAATDAPPSLSDAQFEKLKRFVHEYAGIRLDWSRRESLNHRLYRRMRDIGLRSFDQYVALLTCNDGIELEHFASAITTNVTSFMRERHHFDFLRSVLLPKLLARRAGEKRLRIWSAGCASGEEPYSIAITLLGCEDLLRGWDVKILATDIDNQVLATAREGVYRLNEISVLREQVKSYFLKGTGGQAGLVRVKPAVKQLIEFRPLNLVDPWPLTEMIDVIFCRNVMIYFDKAVQRTLIERFASIQPAGGHLMIGHSESLFGVSDHYEIADRTIYKRREGL